jgi:hypothetical protein
MIPIGVGSPVPAPLIRSFRMSGLPQFDSKLVGKRAFPILYARGSLAKIRKSCAVIMKMSTERMCVRDVKKQNQI